MIIPASYAQANLLFGGAAYPSGAECTIGLDIADAATPAILATRVNAVYTSSGFAADASSSSTYLGCLVKFGPNDTGPFATVAASIPGTVGAQTPAPQNAILVQKLTAVGGRRGRGRLFWPGVTEAQLNPDGTLTAAAVTNLQNSFNSFLSGMTALGNFPRLLHTVEGVAPNSITSFSVQSLTATQRRRLRR